MCVSICVICVIANVMERETEGAREKVFIYECTSKRQGAPHFGATSPNPDQPTPTIDPAEGSTLQCRLNKSTNVEHACSWIQCHGFIVVYYYLNS